MNDIYLRNEFERDGKKRVNTLEGRFSGENSFLLNIKNGKPRGEEKRNYGIIRIDRDQAKNLAEWINDCLK